mmetsp:Transcript_22299/g.34505  ORF Transcript_22299/g.34505 Transcript_22299/m.34505 type:complete len:86 (+) Transcript_22299:3391-3648(+)
MVNNISLISQVSEEAKKVERRESAASFGSKNPNERLQEISFLDSQILKNDHKDNTSTSFKESNLSKKEGSNQDNNSLTLPMLQSN